MITTLGITELIEQFEAKKTVLEDLKERERQVREEAEHLEMQIIGQMADMADDAGLTLGDLKITVGNKSYSATISQKYSILAADRDVAFKGLRMAGFGWLIQETVNAQSFGKEMREQAAANDGELPPDLAALPIKKYEEPKLSARTVGRKGSK